VIGRNDSPINHLAKHAPCSGGPFVAVKKNRPQGSADGEGVLKIRAGNQEPDIAEFTRGSAQRESKQCAIGRTFMLQDLQQMSAFAQKFGRAPLQFIGAWRDCRPRIQFPRQQKSPGLGRGLSLSGENFDQYFATTAPAPPK
jgi:hypothetical protein